MVYPKETEDEELDVDLEEEIPETEVPELEAPAVPVPTPEEAARRPAWWRRAVGYAARRLADAISGGGRRSTTPGQGRQLAREALRRIRGGGG